MQTHIHNFFATRRAVVTEKNHCSVAYMKESSIMFLGNCRILGDFSDHTVGTNDGTVTKRKQSITQNLKKGSFFFLPFAQWEGVTQIQKVIA